MGRPILFSTPMVQAILEGRKNQTRRTKGLKTVNEYPDDWSLIDLDLDPDLIVGENPDGTEKVKSFKGLYACFEWSGLGEIYHSIKCPYGKVGDVLWVRETWTQNGLEYYRYKADFPNNPDEMLFTGKQIPERFRGKWKPSIHMPRIACRIKLKITSIRVERLQDISEEDAKAEGILKLSGGLYENYDYKSTGFKYSVAKLSFKSLWIKINGKENWNTNPWVWVIEFERI